MYNENDKSAYEYHYVYNETNGEPVPALVEKKPKSHKGLKITALVLCACLLVGGAFGAGWLIKGRGWNDKKGTNLLVSDRVKPEVETISVKSGEKMSYMQVYAANVDSCVSINVSSTGYNIFRQPVQNASSGSGFIITKDGYIVTNYHVIKGATQVKVTMNNGDTYDAYVVGGDEDNDIAVIKIEPGETELQPVVIGSADNLQVGEEVLAIGNPLGELTFSLSEGIVSCLNRKINVDGTPFEMIQVTAAVNSGNSGGPLFNTYGEVVGIVSAKYSSSSSGTTVEGLGFAIPIDNVLSLIKDIMENGEVTTKPYLGIMAFNDSQFDTTGVRSGVCIESVSKDGPADKAGLQSGDVITMIGIQTITSRDDITTLSKTYSAGDTVTVTYVRDGQVQSTEMTLGSTADKMEEDTSSTGTQNTPSTQDPNQYQNGNGYYYGDDNMQEFLERYFGGYGW